ncbi:hypothetical protein FSP39_011363 [Pinctada imbricata]|uniref:Uncharacterized protein n=1 Tax=Pinctada imbricata TaxID=66713 RepID=A0AA89BM39_PINIB|nr:hypothetical protein FSP39_011363 [Pinctada imbricata]
MFLGKIHGRSKKVLLSHLVSLYRDGYNVFLRCDTLCYKFTTTTTLFDSHFPKAAEDIDLIHEILYDLHSNCDMNGMCKIISYLQHQIGTHPSCLMIGKIFLQYYTQKYLFCAAQMFELTSNRTCNKTMYDRIRKIIRAIKVHGYDLCSHKILSALVFYKFGMDRHVVRSVLHIRDCMEERQVITTVQYNLTWQYEVQGGKFTSFNSMMKNYLLCRIDLDKHTYFPDLYEEHKASCCRISYSPMVLVDLMLYLSYNTLSMFRAAESVLLHLKRLINYDLEYHISKYDKAISWEILGVCQEIGSHFHDAYLSYQRALREEKATSFRGATVARIEKITSILNRL